MEFYEVFLRKEVTEALRGIRGGQRDRIVAFIDDLITDPFEVGDYSEYDATAREVRIKIIGTYAITFWADHAVREIKITDLRRADGS